jgi:hypothetical protein
MESGDWVTFHTDQIPKKFENVSPLLRASAFASAPAAVAAQRWSDDHLLIFLCHIPKMQQYFLEPAMPLAMAASPKMR